MVLGDGPFLRAADLPDIAVEFKDTLRAGPAMKAVDVLSDQDEMRQDGLPAGKRPVPGMGLFRGDDAPPPIIPLPDETGIAVKSLRSSEFLRPVLFPETVLAPERGNPGLR
jgi:hypothetical protein